MNDKLDKKENVEKRKPTFGEKMSLKMRRNFFGQTVRLVCLVIALISVFFMINAFAQDHSDLRFDLTEGKLYTLTQNSKDVVKDIKDEVKIYIYDSEENVDILKFAKQYTNVNKNITVEIINEENNYQLLVDHDMGLQGNSVLVSSNDENIELNYFNFISQEFINGTPQTVDIMEEAITNAILKVTDKDPAKVYFMSGHGEYQEKDITTLLEYLGKSVFEYEFLSIKSIEGIPQIPEDCDILAILAPQKDYSIDEAQMLKDYINRGGDLFVTLSTLDAKEELVNLNSVLDLYGIKVEDSIIVEGSSNNCISALGQAIPTIVRPNYVETSKITEKLIEPTILPLAQPILCDNERLADLNVSSQILLQTSEKAYKVDDYQEELSIEGIEPKTYALAREMIKTIPAVNEGEKEKESKLVIIGNNLFLSEDNVMLPQPLIRSGENLSFTLNSFKELSEKTNILEISKKLDTETFIPSLKQDRIVKAIVFTFPIIIILIGIAVTSYRKKRD